VSSNLFPEGTASIGGDHGPLPERRRRLQRLPSAVFSWALATGALLFYAFEFHTPASLVDAFLPGW